MKNNIVENKPYFKGWYIKHQVNGNCVAFIPGIYIDKDNNKLAFIQIITNEGSNITYFNYDEFFMKTNKFYVRIGKNTFTEKGINVNIQSPSFNCVGSITYNNFTPLKYDIMGPFSCVSFMECNHEIISLHHTINGQLIINEKAINFNSGIGYIEGNWGSAFPKDYTWIQCNDFKEKCSIFAAIAKVPFSGLTFNGCIAVVYYKGKEIRFGTYNGSKVVLCNNENIIIKKNKYVLKISLNKGKTYPLKAFESGMMNRTINESVSSNAHFELFNGKRKVLDLSSNNVCLEQE